MPKFTIEATYRLPVYRHRTYKAESLEAALAMASNDEDWEGQKEDYDSSGQTYLTGAWEGEEAYPGEFLSEEFKGLPIPPQYDETVQRKAELFDEMLAALRPFAELLDTDCNGYESSPDEDVVRTVGTIGRDFAVITVADLRRAASVIAKTESIKSPA